MLFQEERLGKRLSNTNSLLWHLTCTSTLWSRWGYHSCFMSEETEAERVVDN